MRRKSLILALLVVLLLLAGVGTSLALLLRHEPAFYRRGAIPAGEHRYTWSTEFLNEMFHLSSAIQHDELSWDAEFTTEQTNGYLQEHFVESGFDERMLPDNISDPRVAIDEDRLRLGFRYGFGRWSAIVTIDMRLWVAQGEANTVGLELLGLHAGALPISAQSLLEHVSEAALRSGVDVSWFRYNDHPVALLRFGPDQPRTTVHLKHVELKQGRMVLQGRCSATGGAPTSTASE
jgi:hypothetical protein